MGDTSSSVHGSLLRAVFLGALLCGSSIAQLSIVTSVVRYSNRLVIAAKADPPAAVSAIFPVFLRAASLPWQIVVIGLYGAVIVSVRRQRSSCVCDRVLLTWAIVSAVSFLMLWLAILPLRTCCT